MSRMMKTGLDYFPMDVNFFQNAKIECVAQTYGHAGVVAVVRLMTYIYSHGYFMEWNELACRKLMINVDGLTQEQAEGLVEFLVEWKFFDREMFEAHGVLTSKGIQERYFEATRKRKVARAELPYIIDEAPAQKAVKAPKAAPAPAPAPVAPVAVEAPAPAPAAAPVAAGQVPEVGEFLERFFVAYPLDKLQQMWHINVEEIRALAQLVVREWELKGEPASGWTLGHLFNHMKVKIERGRPQCVAPQAPRAVNNGGGQPHATLLDAGRQAYEQRRQAEREADRERSRQYRLRQEASGESGLDAYLRQKGARSIAEILDSAAG